jgi:outer membrane protein assembly factor BamB
LLSYTSCPSAISQNTIAIAAIPGGLVALVDALDGGSVLQRYLGQDCALVRDPSFAAIISEQSVSTNLAVDARGHVYVGTFPGLMEVDLDGGVTTALSQATSTVAVSSDGLTIWKAFVGDLAQATRATTSAPFVVDPNFGAPSISFVNGIALNGTQLIVGGRESLAIDGHKLFPLDADGGITARWGSNDPFASDGLCSIVSLVPCGNNGVCVADLNCRRFVQWTSNGTIRAAFRLQGQRQPSSIAPISASKAYLLDQQFSAGAQVHSLSVVNGL